MLTHLAEFGKFDLFDNMFEFRDKIEEQKSLSLYESSESQHYGILNKNYNFLDCHRSKFANLKYSRNLTSLKKKNFLSKILWRHFL